MTVELSVGIDLVRACVTDPGPGFEATPREPGDDPGSGWGLFLVEQLSDRWGVELAGGTSVWFEIDRRANGQELQLSGGVSESGSRVGRTRGRSPRLQHVVGAVDHVEALGDACDLEHALNDLGSLDDHHAAVVLIAA